MTNLFFEELEKKSDGTYEKEIRAKAIDEFAEVLLNQDIVDKSVIRRVKEQLKGGEE